MGIRHYFNNLFGSNDTFVANAYSGSEYIWLLFLKNSNSIEKVSINPDGELKIVLTNREVISKLRLPYKNLHKEERNQAYEYLSVFADGGDGEVVTICENYEIPANYSYIVTDEGQLIRKGPGNNLWVDRGRYDHFTERHL